HDVVQTLIRPEFMTLLALGARLVTLVMALGIVATSAKLARETWREEGTSTFVAIATAVGTAFTYYAHTSNLDVPYLSWTELALVSLARASLRRGAKLLGVSFGLAAAAVATKAQAYAAFLVTFPLPLAVVIAYERVDRRQWLSGTLRAALWGAGAILVFDLVP